MYVLIEAPEGDRQHVTLLTVKRQLWASSCPIKVTTRELHGPFKRTGMLLTQSLIDFLLHQRDRMHLVSKQGIGVPRQVSRPRGGCKQYGQY